MDTDDMKKKQWDEQIADIRGATEEQMKDAKVPHISTEDGLMEYINALVDRPHDYRTCVHAISMAATAAFEYVCYKLGATGYQASMADLGILRRTRGWEWGRLLDYNNLLYPQYHTEEHFPSLSKLLEDNKDKLAEEAKKLLAKESSFASDRVIKHWKWLANGQPDRRNQLE